MSILQVMQSSSRCTSRRFFLRFSQSFLRSAAPVSCISRKTFSGMGPCAETFFSTSRLCSAPRACLPRSIFRSRSETSVRSSCARPL